MHEAQIRVAIVGAGGRMGRQLIQAALHMEGIQPGAALEREGSSLLGSDAGELAGVGKMGVIVQSDLALANAMDHSLLFQHLQALKRGSAIELPVYSYVEHTRMQETVRVEPKKVIILEGILLLTDARLREEMNFSIFVDTPLDICLMRRIKRDVNERGRSMDSVMAQYQKTVRPMFLQFIEPSKQYADIIVPRGGKNRIAIDILKAKISQFFE